MLLKSPLFDRNFPLRVSDVLPKDFTVFLNFIFRPHFTEGNLDLMFAEKLFLNFSIIFLIIYHYTSIIIIYIFTDTMSYTYVYVK